MKVFAHYMGNEKDWNLSEDGLHEVLQVLLTKLSSARDNSLLMDNYVMKHCEIFLED